MVQKPEMPHLKGLLEEVDEPDGPLAGVEKEFVKLSALLMMSYISLARFWSVMRYIINYTKHLQFLQHKSVAYKDVQSRDFAG